MEIRLRFIEIDGDLAAKSLLINGDAHKQKALDVLGIIPKDGETAFSAWIRAMCEENNLPYSKPAPKELADAITHNVSAARFAFLLA